MAYPPGNILIVTGGLGIPSIVRVEPDGSWLCIAGIFQGRHIRTDKTVRYVCQDGDIFEDLGLAIHRGALVPIDMEQDQ